MSIRPILAFGLSLLPLLAQGYDTKFKAIGFKPGDMYHSEENVSVALTGGGVEARLPLGPALPGPLALRPQLEIHSKFTLPANPNWSITLASEDGWNTPKDMPLDQAQDVVMSWKRFLPPSLPSSSLHPGKLKLGSVIGARVDGPALSVTTPQGVSLVHNPGLPGTANFDPQNQADRNLIQDLVTKFAPNWMNGRFWGVSGYSQTAFRTSNGSIFIHGGTTQTLIYFKDKDNLAFKKEVQIPCEILQVDQDVVILWGWSRNAYAAGLGSRKVKSVPFVQSWTWAGSVYHPKYLRTRSGYQVNIEIFRDAPKTAEVAALTGNGLLRGWKVSNEAGTVGYSVGRVDPADTSNTVVKYFGMGTTPNTTGALLSGRTPYKATDRSEWDRDIDRMIGWDWWAGLENEEEYVSDELRMEPYTVADFNHGGLITRVEMVGMHGLLSRVVSPNGKLTELDYEWHTGPGATYAPSVGGISHWIRRQPMAVGDVWSACTRMAVKDGVASQDRVTTYRYLVPKALDNNTDTDWTWADPRQATAQTLPDGQTVVYLYAPMPPPNTLLEHLHPTTSEGAKLLAQQHMAMRQAPLGEWHYEAGDSSWESFFTSGAPSEPYGTWAKRVRKDGYDLRAWQSTLEWLSPSRWPLGDPPYFLLSFNAEPRATRTISEESGGPVHVSEQEEWYETANDYRINRETILPPGTNVETRPWAPGAWSDDLIPFLPSPGIDEVPMAGALHHQVRVKYFTYPIEGLFARVFLVNSSVNAASKFPGGFGDVVGRLPDEFTTYGSEPGTAHRVIQKRFVNPKDSSQFTLLDFNQSASNPSKVEQLLGVTLSGGGPNLASSGNQSGLVGATYAYDTSTGLWRTSIQPKGVTWKEQEPGHDALGRPTQQLDPNGLASTFTWDALGRLTRLTLPGEVATTLSYPTFAGQALRQATQLRGAQTSRFYLNGHGELIGEDRLGKDGQWSHKLYGYDLGGRKVFESTWRPNAFTATQAGDWATPGTETVSGAWVENVCIGTIYDPDLRQRVCVAWDQVNHPAVVDANVVGTRWTFDGRGRVTRVTNPNGEVTETRYDVGNNPLVTQQVQAPGTPLQRVTTFTRNAAGRLIQVTDALGQVTSYAYDAAGRIAQVRQQDEQGRVQTRSWRYDGLGRLVVLDQPESGVTYYTSFTVAGKPTETVFGLPRGWRPVQLGARDPSAFTQPSVKTLTSQFDTLGRLVRQVGPGVDQSFTYDTAPTGKGKLAKATEGPTARELSYDPATGRLAQLTRRVDGLAFLQTLSYDTYGRLQSRTYPGHSNPALAGPAQGLSYDLARGLPQGSTFNGATLLNLVDYDPTHWGLTKLVFANGGGTDLAYGPDQTRLATMIHAVPGALGKLWKYTYDALGQLGGDGEDTYAYDALGRLTSVAARDPFGAATAGVLQQFAFDGFGNRKALSSYAITWTSAPGAATGTYTLGALSAKPGLRTFALSEVEQGQQAERNRLPAQVGGVATGALTDAQGNLTRLLKQPGDWATQLTLGYDALGRVTTLADAQRSTTESYLHDDEGLRLKVADSATGKVTYHIYNEARQLIASFEKVGTGPLTWKKDILYVGTKEVAEVDGTGKTWVTFVDHLGSPRFTWNGTATTRIDGVNLIQQKFMPFGESLATPADAAKFAKGFTNHEQTDASGLIYMQARFYVPWFGRFLSPDPARDQHFEETQSWNIFSYVRNDPTMKIDPTGMVAGGLGDWLKEKWKAAKEYFNFDHHSEDRKEPAKDGHGTTRYGAVDLERKVSLDSNGLKASFKTDAAKVVTTDSKERSLGPITLETSGSHKKEFISTSTSLDLNEKEASVSVGGQVGQSQLEGSFRLGVNIPLLGVNIGLGGSISGGVAIGAHGKVVLAGVDQKSGQLEVLKAKVGVGFANIAFNGITVKEMKP